MGQGLKVQRGGKIGKSVIHDSFDKTGISWSQYETMKMSVETFSHLEGADVFIMISHPSASYGGFAIIRNFGTSGYIEYAEWTYKKDNDYATVLENAPITISDGYYVPSTMFQSFALNNGTPRIIAVK